MGFLSSLFGTRKMNADPDQRQFAELLIQGAQSGSFVAVNNWLVKQPWSPSETRTRVIHALTLVRMWSPPEVYERAKQMGEMIHSSSYQLE